MNKREAEIISQFVIHHVATMLNLTGMSTETILDKFLQAAEGQPGTGVCICKQSPDHVAATAAKWQCKFEAANLNMMLDHRCPHHGEKAQPILWGRHKEKELLVTPHQWLSLGVTRSETP